MGTQASSQVESTQQHALHDSTMFSTLDWMYLVDEW